MSVSWETTIFVMYRIRIAHKMIFITFSTFGGFPLHSDHLLEECEATRVSMESMWCQHCLINRSVLDVWNKHRLLIVALIRGGGGTAPIGEAA